MTKTVSQYQNQHASGAISCTKGGAIGSLSCISSGATSETIYYILGGVSQTKGTVSRVVSAEVVPFPLAKQGGKVADVARKLARCRTMRHREYYRHQVTESLRRRLGRFGVVERKIDHEIAALWHAVAVVSKVDAERR